MQCRFTSFQAFYCIRSLCHLRSSSLQVRNLSAASKTDSKRSPIIDAWGQHITLRHAQDPVFDSLRNRTKTLSFDKAPSIDMTLAAMNEGNIDKMLISAWYAPDKVMISNEEVFDFVSQSNGRLVGIGSVNITKPGLIMKEIRRCVEKFDFKGIRVLPWLFQIPPTDRRFYPVYVACCELKIPFCTQIGHTGVMMPSEVGRPIYLDQVALDFPDLTIVAGHIGYPWTDEAISIATKHPNVYIDTSGYPVRHYPAALVDYMRHHGRHKVVFASNYPVITPAKALQALDQLRLEESTSALFLGQNAARIFQL